jgi:hypothetical protein
LTKYLTVDDTFVNSPGSKDKKEAQMVRRFASKGPAFLVLAAVFLTIAAGWPWH